MKTREVGIIFGAIVVVALVIWFGAPQLQSYASQNQAAIQALSSLIVAAFTVVLAWFAYTQSTITRETLVTNQRAFVYPDVIDHYWTPTTNGQYTWRFRVRWKNSGD